MANGREIREKGSVDGQGKEKDVQEARGPGFLCSSLFSDESRTSGESGSRDWVLGGFWCNFRTEVMGDREGDNGTFLMSVECGMIMVGELVR